MTDATIPPPTAEDRAIDLVQFHETHRSCELTDEGYEQLIGIIRRCHAVRVEVERDAAVEAARVEERESIITMLPCCSVTNAMKSAKTCEQWNAAYRTGSSLCTHCGIVALIRNRITATKGEQQS